MSIIPIFSLIGWIGNLWERENPKADTAQVVEEGVLVEHFTIAPLDSTEYITPPPSRKIVWSREAGTNFSYAVAYKTSKGEEGVVEYPGELTECRGVPLPAVRSIRFISRDTIEAKITMWILPIGTARPCA